MISSVVSRPRLSEPLPPALPRPKATPPVPLQLRTPEQLRDGMTVTVKGVGSNDLAVARLMQDGAEFVARTAGTTMGLGTVSINDASMDRAGALGMATFQGNKGWFGLSKRSTEGLLSGIERLRSRPFEQWTEAERNAFVQANATVLHEAGHVTLPAYDGANIAGWRTANRDFEEGLTELVTMGQLNDFMRQEYGVAVPALTDRIQRSTSAYTRFSERIDRMIHMATDGSAKQSFEAARLLADNTRADLRVQRLAQMIATNLGGASAPAETVREIEALLPRFVREENGTRTRLMELMAQLRDRAGSAPTPSLVSAMPLPTPLGREIGSGIVDHG